MTEITPALRDWMTRVVTPLQNCVVLVKSLMHTYTSAAHDQFTDLVQAQRGAHALPHESALADRKLLGTWFRHQDHHIPRSSCA